MKSVRSLWLLFVCCLAELTVFVVISFGQTLPASQQLRLLQPNGKERLQSGSEYTIKWTGIDSARSVRLEYSTNGGKSWERITDKAFGGSYLWKPIPNEPSDSCLILATGLPADSTEGVGRSLVQFQVERFSSNGSQYSASDIVKFSPDGTKVLILSWSDPMVLGSAFYGWKQLNRQVRDGRTGAVLYNLPPYVSNAIAHPRLYSWWWWGQVGDYGCGTNTLSCWHPDNKTFLAQITDSAFGIYNAQTGALVRSITVPSQGDRTRIASIQWTGAGQEILAMVKYHFFNQSDPNGTLDTMRAVMMRLSASTGLLTSTPFQTGMVVWSGKNCSEYWPDWGMGSVSNDGERRLSYGYDSTCTPGLITIRSTRDNSLLQIIGNIPRLVRTHNSRDVGYDNIKSWSPNDSLLVFPQVRESPRLFSFLFINSHTSQVVQNVNTSDVNENDGTWSPDSQKYLIDSYTPPNPVRLAIDIQTGTVQSTLPRGFGKFSLYSYYGSYYELIGDFKTNFSPSNSSVSWSPDGRYVADFVSLRQNIFSANLPNTVGIWDAKTGCLLQTFRLPFPDETNAPTRRTFHTIPIQWSPDGKRLLLFSPALYSQPVLVNNGASSSYMYSKTDYDGMALIASINVDQIPCQEDRSDTVWTILPRGRLRVANASFPTVQCNTTPTSIILPVANTSLGPLSIRLPIITGANASDFSLISINGSPIDSTMKVMTLTTSNYQRQLEVRFTPNGFGNRIAQMIFTDTSGVELETITLTGRKDTLAIAPTNLRLSFARALQNSTTSASVSFRNLSTVPLYWDGQMFSQTPPLQTSGQMSGQQFQSAAGSFRVDSIAPGMVAPGDSGRVYVTFLRTDKEGIFTDSSTVLRCGVGASQLLVTAEIVPNTPRMEVDSLLDFGHLVCETSSSATLRVRNTGGKLLRIFNVGILNDMFQTSITKRDIVIQPFEFLDIPLTFTPSVGGLTESAVVLNSDDPKDSFRSIRLRGRKTLFQYEWQPPTLDFGNVSFGASRARTVTFVNQGTEPYRWTLPRTLTDDYIIERVEPNPVPQGTSATVTVRFLGRREAMPVVARLDVPMNDACKTTTRFDLTARVLNPQPHIVIADTVRLAALSCASETRSTITISNDGDADLRIDAFAVEGVNKFDFPKDSIRLGATTLKPQGTTQLDFLFQALDTGARTATLVLKTNDTATARNGEIRVVLVGRKDSVGFVLNRQPRSLTTVDENTPLYDTLTIRNTGTVPLAWTNTANPQASLPFRIDTAFTIERIEPVITPPQGSSNVVVRFRGGVAGFLAERQILLQGSSTLAPVCSRPLALTVVGEVRKEPRLAQVADVSSRLLCENTTTLTIRLASVGTDDVLIQSVDLVENPSSVFSNIQKPSRIAARTGRDSIVITARTAQTGLFTAKVRILSNAANLPVDTVLVAVRKDSSGLQAIPSAFDFGGFAANTSVSRTVSIVNTGTIAQGFGLPLRAGVFVVDSLGINPLPGNSQTQARVRFAGGTGGVERDTLRVADSCGRVLMLPLQARVISGVVALPDTVALASNEESELPILLANRKGVERGMEAEVRVKIGNATLVEVLSPLASGVERKQDSLWLTYRMMIPSEDSKDALVRLRVRGLLGNATTTTVRVDSAVVGGVVLSTPSYAATTHYRVLGLNFAGGGVRLLYVPRVQVIAIAPNPSAEDVSVRLRLKEATSMVVQVVDMLGHRCLLFEGDVREGEQALRLKTSDLASGVYALEIRAGSETITTMMTVFH